MAPRWSDETNIKFVELYKKNRCLWDPRHDLYKDKNARIMALSEIASEMNMEGFGVAEAKMKIKSLRGTFNIEFAKQQRSMKSGSVNVYVPILKWYNVMKEVMVKETLRKHTTSPSIGPGTSGMESSSNSNQMATSARAQYLAMEEMSNPSATPENLPVTQETHLEFPVIITPHSPKRNERTQTPTDVESCYDLSYAPSNADRTEHAESRYPDEMDHTERPAGVMEDTLDLFGRYVSSILRQLPVTKSYTLQQKFINEAISAKLQHESQHPSIPPCQNGTSFSMNNITATPLGVSHHTNTVVSSNNTSQRKRRKRKTSSSCVQPSSPSHIKQEVEESELSDLRGGKEITDIVTIVSEDGGSIEIEEGHFIGIKSEIDESDSAPSSEHNSEGRMAGNVDERLGPRPSSHSTNQTSSEHLFICPLCSMSFTTNQDMRNHLNKQHPDNPYAKTKPPNENPISSKRQCIKTGSTYYPTTLPDRGDNLDPYATLASSKTHRYSSFSTTSRGSSLLESTKDPLT